jgi:pentose-5-phosphate-3-epimerase
VSGPGLVTGTAKASKKTVAKGRKTVTKAGTVKVTLKATKAGKRLLKRKRSVKVKVKLVFKPTTGVSVKKTVSARLRR